MNGRKEHIIQSIRKMSKEVIPETGKVILFGSQARGDSHEESNWDLLILLDKNKLTSTDYDDFAYPFFELGWHINAQIHPLLHTFKEWEQRSYLPFHKNITKGGIELRQSGD
ncbi:MAG TPA: nucleotidyltransferase domain-containing protein [Candidatus Phocaeicola excrementigallinarum]|nr:nucleotidyltransferase domain-containing protein [Candidatus Phocaeicola excrementigallinarum]